MAQSAFGKLLFPSLVPIFGYIDAFGENEPSERALTAHELPYLFWAMFFGPPYVERYGREFLLDAPGWRKEELEGGGVLYVTHPSFSAWHAAPDPAVVEYFRTQAPTTRLYRATPVDIA